MHTDLWLNPATFAQVDTSNFDKMLTSMGAVLDAAALSNIDRHKLMAFVQSQRGAGTDDEKLGTPPHARGLPTSRCASACASSDRCEPSPQPEWPLRA